MINLRKAKSCFFAWAFLSGLLCFGFTQMAQAEEREFRHPEFREFRDLRHHHDRFYPARGQFVDVLPGGHRVVFLGKERYFFFGGIWYRPVGRRFLIVAPPIGLVVPFLPPYYTTIWVGNVPYYYANEVYYAQTPGGYAVVEPPMEEVGQTPPPPGPPPPPPAPSAQMPANQVFVYPRQGQSPQKQAADRRECHNWALGQTGFDPAKPPVGMPETQMAQKQDEFLRAQGACLEGRGYTVR